MKIYNSCRCCGNNKLTKWLSLPASPVANALFVKPNYVRYKLDLNYCSECGHLQLAGAPNPDGVFSEYRYKSGVSNSFQKHFTSYATTVNELFTQPGYALEIGSNDGYLLSKFKDIGWNVIGVEPSEYLIEEHTNKGVDVITGFFTTEMVKSNSWENKFDLICANNVLAHIPDMLDVVTGIEQALTPNGVLIVECGNQSGILSGKYLDNVYHEHIDYYSPYSFSKLLSRVGLVVENVEGINTHGVSFRITARKKEGQSIIEFQPANMHIQAALVNVQIEVRKVEMKTMINNRPFIAYGAAAKAVTALYTLGLVDGNLVGVVDDNELKQNCYFPGTSILITSPEIMDKDALVVITAWNVYEDIKNKLVERGHTGEILCLQ
jgi:SAM-dependent methyltransferase